MTSEKIINLRKYIYRYDPEEEYFCSHLGADEIYQLSDSDLTTYRRLLLLRTIISGYKFCGTVYDKNELMGLNDHDLHDRFVTVRAMMEQIYRLRNDLI